MIHVAVCDDDASVCDLLCAYLRRYAKDNRLEIGPVVFTDGLQILEADCSSIDLLIMDIQMPGLNGLDTARQLRRSNQRMPIIFFTNYIQYALEGYEVQAFRFLLKPLDYAQFSDVVGKALSQISRMRKSLLSVRVGDEMQRIPIGDISCVETDRGRILIHHKGQVIACRATMQSVERALAEHGFFRCHKAYIVALGEIRSVGLTDITLVDGSVIPLSKHRKKELKETLTIFWGEQFL